MRASAGVCGAWELTYRHPRDRGWRSRFPNGATDEWVNLMLNAAFLGGVQFSSFYIGLIDGSTAPAVSAADTAGSHPGWAEYAGVFGGLRGAWNRNAAAAAGVLAGTAATSISLSASGTVRGAFLATAQAVGATAGFLVNTGLAAADLAVSAGGVITVTYTARLTGQE